MSAKHDHDGHSHAEAQHEDLGPPLPHVVIADPSDAPSGEIAEELVDKAEISDGKSLVKLSASEAHMLALKAESEGIDYALIPSDKDIEKQAREFRVRVSASITALKARGLQLRAPAADFAKKVLEAERAIEKQLRDIMLPGDEALTQLDSDRKAEKDRRLAAEAAAAEAVSNAIAAFSARPASLMGAPAVEIESAIAVLDAADVTEAEFGRRAGEALRAKTVALASMRQMHEGALRLEAQQSALAAEQAKLQRSQNIQQALDAISQTALQAFGKSASEISSLINQLEQVDVMDEAYGDRDAEALVRRDSALASLRQLRVAAESAEKLEAEQKARQAELDAQAAAQAERQAALDKEEKLRKEAAALEERRRAERAAEIERLISAMRDKPDALEATEASSAAIEAELRTLNDTIITEAQFGDRHSEAAQVRITVLDALRQLHTDTSAREQQEAEERERLAEQRRREIAEALKLEAAREAIVPLLEVLKQWRSAELVPDDMALAAIRRKRDQLLDKLGY